MDAWMVLALIAAWAMFSALLVLVPIFVVLYRLRRRNRVSPDQPTPAPITWLSSPTRAARLHRRLRSAVAVARMIAERATAEGRLSRASELAFELEAEALSIDRQLPIVARLAPRERGLALGHITGQVVEVERLVSRLSVLEASEHARPRLGHHGTAMEELSRQLEALEAARAEVNTIDSEAGLA
jgi:hypothetical protein